MRRTLAVCRRELYALYARPLGWVLGCVFAVLAGYFFWSELAFFRTFRRQQSADGLVAVRLPRFSPRGASRPAALTMRMFAEERKLGTLELLWTLPVRDGEVLAGKFLAASVAYLLMLASTVVGPATLWLFHPFAVGPVLAGYCGMLLLGAGLIACGLAASAVTENQVVSAMLTYGVLVFLWFVTWNEAALSERVAPILLQLSLFDHFYGFAQGVIDSRHVAWLLAFTAFFLFLAHRALGARAWRGIS